MEGLLAGRYLPLEPAGEGAVATVWRAFDGLAEEVVALKVPHAGGGMRARRELLAEAVALGRLRHPGIVRPRSVEAFGEGSAGTPFLVLDYVDARPALTAPQARTPSGAREVAAQVLGALAHLHREGLVHRDLKPANLLVGGPARRPRATLVDLGSSVASGRGRGRYAGTPAWTAPEVLAGAAADPRADLYSLGLVLHRLAGGPPPYDADDPFGLSRFLLAPRPLDDLRAPADLAALVAALTRPDPAARPRSAGEALAYLGTSEDRGVAARGAAAGDGSGAAACRDDENGMAGPGPGGERAGATRPGRLSLSARRALRAAFTAARARGRARVERAIPRGADREAFLFRASLEALRAGFRPVRPVAPGGGPPRAVHVRRALLLWAAASGRATTGRRPSNEGEAEVALRLASRGLPPLALLVEAAAGSLTETAALLRSALSALRAPHVAVLVRDASPPRAGRPVRPHDP